MIRLAIALAALATAAPAAARQRPSEEELFGAPAQPAPAPEAAQERKAGGRGEVEAEMFGSSGSPSAVPPPPEGIVSKERDDPLRLGGQLYLRSATTWQDGLDPEDWSLSLPNLLDVFLDVRPNDRVRAFVLGRMGYDPSLDGEPEDAERAFVQELLLGPPPSNPRVVLDQLWVNFDVGRRVFVTAGKQHVKWGTGKFWNPTDWLHSVRRDPLAVFDPRTGTSMLKLHVPWEARGWNAYGYLVFDETGTRPVAARRLGRVGAAARTEMVLGTFELGLDALVREGRRPRFGADASLGVWELDLHAEAALRSGADAERWTRDPADPVNLGLRKVRHEGLTPQIVVGATWSTKYSDEDAITVGAEYFYDDTGYEDAKIYPYLIAVPLLSRFLPGFPEEPSPFTPFYLGKHQAALFASLPAPGSWNDTTFTLSALANLSDGSVLVRLDHSVLAVTYLRVETYVAGHLGTRGGELRFALDADPAEFGISVPGVRRVVQPPPVLDLGIALRVSL